MGPKTSPDGEVRLLAIDPSLRGTGYGVLAMQGRRMQALEFGTISNPVAWSQSKCLVKIFSVIDKLVDTHAPQQCAIEGVIYVQSKRTAITLGAARAAAILPVARSDIPIYEYAPRRVKQAVIGHGGADKSQVAFMVRALLELTVTPDADAADALAIGITHLRSSGTAIPGKTSKL